MWFAFRSKALQPFQIIGTGLSMFVRLPFWLLISLYPALRPRPSWSVKRSVMIRILRVYVDVLFQVGFESTKIDPNTTKDADQLGLIWVDPPPNALYGEVKEMAEINGIKPERVAGYWVGTRGDDGHVGQKPAHGEKVLYRLHGGGYIMDTAHPKQGNGVSYVAGFLTTMPNLFSRVFSIEYRLASAPPFEPAGAFPAALLDALAGYNYLVNVVGFHPDNIVVTGDSAGGNLTYTLTRYLATYQIPTLSVPKAVILHSPTLDIAITHSGAGSSWSANQSTDFCANYFISGYTARALGGNLPPTEFETNPWLSPSSLKISDSSGLFKGFPKTCIVAGGAEIQLDSYRTTEDRAIADIGKENVLYFEGPDATHNYLSLDFHEPERTNSFIRIHDWLEEIL